MSGSILYLGGSLPTLSETFVSGEVLGLRARGVAVPTATVHEPGGGLGDPALGAMAAESIRVYGDRPMGVLPDAARHALRSPVRSLRVLCGAVRDVLVEPDVPGVKKIKVLWQALAGLALARRIGGRGVVHIHAHMAHVPATIAMYAAGASGVGFSFTGHAVDLFKERTLLRAKLRRAAFVACISAWHREFYIGEVPSVAGRSPIVRCGVEIPPARESAILSGSSRPVRVLAVGRLVRKKGFDVLIRGLGVLGREGVAYACALIGDGPERGALEKLAADEGVAVRFEGSRPNSAVREMMQWADFFVLPCRVASDGDRDGIPVVLMEAMASGVCAVSGDLPAIRELIRDGETGVLVPPDDAGALASTLSGLISDPARARGLASAGRAWVEREFSRRVNLDRLIGAFEDLAGVETGADRADGGGEPASEAGVNG